MSDILTPERFKSVVVRRDGYDPAYDEILAHDAALRAENARLRRIERAARELFRSLDYVAPGWRDEACSVGSGSDEVNVAWATLEHALIARAALAGEKP